MTRNYFANIFLISTLLMIPHLSGAATLASSNGNLNVRITSITSPVERGNKATIKVKTAADTSCNITVTYSSGVSHANGLRRKTANAKGKISWTWTIGGSTKPGRYPIDISCKNNGLRTNAATKIKIKE